jgi:TolB-like protein/Tfp pilus assembly protein PilF
MTDDTTGGSGASAEGLADPERERQEREKQEREQQKKREKSRSAWFTFASRVVAQVVGAIATVVLTIFVVRHYSPPAVQPGPESAAPAALPAALAPGEISLAVLPLDNFSGDPAQDYLADGMTEAITADLARMQGWRIISRTSSIRFKGLAKSIPEIARELGVTHVVEGSVVRVDQRVRVTAQLIEAAADRHVWANTYERTARDILSLQSDVATAIAKEINIVVSPEVKQRFAERGPVNPDAYALYLKGRNALALRTPEGFTAAIRAFEEAATLDPGFARAYSGLSDTYTLLSRSVYATGAPDDVMARARKTAERAIALDPLLAEAHTSLASVYHRFDWDWANAEREFRRAIEIRPSYAQAHQWLSLLLAEQGRLDEARLAARRATALDPLSAAVWRTTGLVEYFARDFVRAEQHQRRALDLDPGSAVTRIMLAWALVKSGKSAEALQVTEQIPPDGPQDIDVRATIGYAAATAGEVERARRIQKELLARQVPPSLGVVRLHGGLGDQQALLRSVERAISEKHDLVTGLNVDPTFDIIRKEPRFVALLKQLKFAS